MPVALNWLCGSITLTERHKRSKGIGFGVRRGGDIEGSGVPAGEGWLKILLKIRFSIVPGAIFNFLTQDKWFWVQVTALFHTCDLAKVGSSQSIFKRGL